MGFKRKSKNLLEQKIKKSKMKKKSQNKVKQRKSKKKKNTRNKPKNIVLQIEIPDMNVDRKF